MVTSRAMEPLSFHYLISVEISIFLYLFQTIHFSAVYAPESIFEKMHRKGQVRPGFFEKNKIDAFYVYI